ncbi:carbamoyltransferase C-terminal domain-containing protein [Streptomyces sp. NPDC089919]|uniref:carbamoyltransferase C-terminal domain-containing protein n=1 Tax=Streptomyces sp. NPDC089919 TaxID=3155188 RepID=UPI0034349395
MTEHAVHTPADGPAQVPVEHYLSTYLTPPGERSVLSPRHDHNIALWRRRAGTVELVRHWELERISGRKHHSLPLYTPQRAEAFLTGLLATEGLTPADLTATWGTPGLPGHTELALPAGSEGLAVHTLAHLFSGLLMDSRIFKEETIVGLAVDAAPDLILEAERPAGYYAGCVSVRGAVTFAAVESPAPLYHAADRRFGKEPGTLMALATASVATIDFDAGAAVGRIELYGGRTLPWPAAFGLLDEVIAAAREQLDGQPSQDVRFSDEDNLQSAVMKVVQRCCDLVIMRNVERLCALADVRPEDSYLSMSGGFALNCPTNTVTLDRYGFKGLLAPPCANDSGEALGIGLLGLHGIGAFEDADLRIATAYHGNELRDVDEALAEFAPWIEQVSEFSPETFVADLADSVVAWADGAAEMGPRALGHRSLLGDPRSEKVKDLLNEYKQRQWWRPVAPIVLAEHAEPWFVQRRPSPFMLEAVEVRAEVRERVPAILHLDGSARHQTLTAEANPLLHRAMTAFHAATGVPIVCNTSLNDRGEPIVDTAAQTLTFCVRKGIPVAYLGGRRVLLRTEPNPPAAVPDGPRPREDHWFAGQEADRDAYWQGWLDRGYTPGGLLLMTGTPQLLDDPDTYTPGRVNLLAERVAAADPGFAQGLADYLEEQDLPR